VDANGNGTWRVTINRGVVPDGTYTGTLVVNSTTGDIVGVNVEVIMQKTTAPIGVTGNAGRHYVLLVDPVTNAAPFQTSVDVDKGRYVFSISGIQPGNYVLIAGTDLNGDFTICDPGEACGAWPTLDQPATLTINASRSSLDFSTSFDATLAGTSLSASSPPRRYLRTSTKSAQP
jgi:serine protease